MNDVTWTLSLEVKGGPKFALPPDAMKVDAYDKIDIDLSERGQNTVRIQPSTDPSEIMFFLVMQNDYKAETPPDPTKRISYLIEPAVSAQAAKDSGTGNKKGKDASLSIDKDYHTQTVEEAAADQAPASQAASQSTAQGDNRVVLERVHLVIGAGAMKLFRELPTTITFYNERDRPASITVLVGRKLPAERRIDMRPFNPAGGNAG